jgi:NAD(P)H-nitrite reductase large subunit
MATNGKNVIIIGNGISGITCARHIRKNSDFNITVISAESKYFYSRTALMYIYMGHLKQEHTQPYENDFWEKNRINLVQKTVIKIHTENNNIELSDGEFLNYEYLVIATGSKSNKFGWPGQDLKGVQGLYNLQDVQNMETYTSGIQRAVVVGGGLIGIETVEMLLSRNIKVTFLVRENSFWDLVLPPEESMMINNLIQHHGVDLQLATELKEIVSDENGRVKSITTSKGEVIDCGFVALTVGVSPNIDFIKNSGINTDRGVFKLIKRIYLPLVIVLNLYSHCKVGDQLSKFGIQAKCMGKLLQKLLLVMQHYIILVIGLIVLNFLM